MKEQIEQQAIEEMRKDLIEIFDEEYKKRRMITPDFTAEKMTAKGYRKQSEGEWIVHTHHYECSNCRFVYETDVFAEDYNPITDFDLYFCSVCGAKMKGGAE